MATIHNIDILLGARTEGLDKGLDRSKGRVTGFQRQVEGIGQAAAGALGPIRELGRGLLASIPGASAAAAAFQATISAFSTKTVADTARSATQNATLAASSGAAALSTSLIAKNMGATATVTTAAAAAMTEFAVAAAAAALASKAFSSGGGRMALPRFQAPRLAGPAIAGPSADVLDAEFKTLSGVPGKAAIASRSISAIGPVGLAAGAAVAGAFVAVTAAAVGTGIAIAGVREQMGAIDEIAKAADRANVTFKELAGFRLAVGESTGLGPEAADKALMKLQIRLGEAKRNGGALADQLKSMGLDAGRLLQAGPIEAMNRLSVATQRMKSPTDQLGLAFKLFEEEGSALVTTLRGGPEAIAAATTAAENLGLTLSQSQAKQVEAANDAWGRVKLIATGVFRQIAAEVAPVITVIAQSIDAGAQSFGGWQSVLPTIVDNLTIGAGFVYDMYELSKLAYNVLHNLATLNFSGAAESIKTAFDFSTGDKMLAKVQAARDAAAAASNGPPTGLDDLAAIEAQAEAQKNAAETAKRTAEERDRAAQQSRDAVTSRLSSLRDEVATLRMGADAVDRMKLARQGATAAQLAGFDAMTREKKQVEELQDAMQRGAALREQFATPAQKMQKELTDLRGLLDVGAIDFETFASAAREAAGRLRKSEDRQRSEPPPSFGALQKGSVEAFSAALRNEKAGSQEKLQQEGNKLLAAINTGIAQMAQQRGQTIGNAG